MCVNLWQKKIHQNLKQLAKKQKSKTGLGADVLKKNEIIGCVKIVYIKKGWLGFVVAKNS